MRREFEQAQGRRRLGDRGLGTAASRIRSPTARLHAVSPEGSADEAVKLLGEALARAARSAGQE